MVMKEMIFQVGLEICQGLGKEIPFRIGVESLFHQPGTVNKKCSGK